MFGAAKILPLIGALGPRAAHFLNLVRMFGQICGIGALTKQRCLCSYVVFFRPFRRRRFLSLSTQSFLSSFSSSLSMSSFFRRFRNRFFVAFDVVFSLSFRRCRKRRRKIDDIESDENEDLEIDEKQRCRNRRKTTASKATKNDGVETTKETTKKRRRLYVKAMIKTKTSKATKNDHVERGEKIDVIESNERK